MTKIEWTNQSMGNALYEVENLIITDISDAELVVISVTLLPVKNLLNQIERFSNDCRNTKTKATTEPITSTLPVSANHEPMEFTSAEQSDSRFTHISSFTRLLENLWQSWCNKKWRPYKIPLSVTVSFCTFLPVWDLVIMVSSMKLYNTFPLPGDFSHASANSNITLKWNFA